MEVSQRREDQEPTRRDGDEAGAEHDVPACLRRPGYGHTSPAFKCQHVIVLIYLSVSVMQVLANHHKTLYIPVKHFSLCYCQIASSCNDGKSVHAAFVPVPDYRVSKHVPVICDPNVHQ